MKFKSIIAKCLRHGLLPLLPARWRLPFKLWLHLNFESVEPELVHLATLVPRGGVAVDAGANIGLYSLSLARLCKKVYAFEINDLASRDLKAYAHPKIELINIGLSNRTGVATLYTPVYPSGLISHGWSSLQPTDCPGIQRHIETQVSLSPLDAFSILECDFLKIDVEGHEVELLEGALETLRRTRPIILAEVREHNADRVTALLDQLGYERTSLHEMIGVKGGHENVVFLPSAAVV